MNSCVKERILPILSATVGVATLVVACKFRVESTYAANSIGMSASSIQLPVISGVPNDSSWPGVPVQAWRQKAVIGRKSGLRMSAIWNPSKRQPVANSGPSMKFFPMTALNAKLTLTGEAGRSGNDPHRPFATTRNLLQR